MSRTFDDIIDMDYDLDNEVNELNPKSCCETCGRILKWIAIVSLVLIVISVGIFATFLVVKNTTCTMPIYQPRMDCRLMVIDTQTTSTQFKSFAELISGTYATCYSDIGMPIWTANRVQQNNGNCPKRPGIRFQNNFGALLNTQDYINSGYDRGHMTPAADLCYKKEITFDMINIAPQNPQFNQKIYRSFEDWIRNNYVGYVVVTTMLQKWGNEEGKVITLNNKKTYYAAGFCKIVLENNNTVLWWGCIKQSEPLTRFDDLLKTGNLHPPQYTCKYPIGD